MPDLIAQGADPRHRWRRTVIAHVPVVLGRAAGSWDTPWDPQISRRHARLLWKNDQLTISRIPESCNPIYYRGEAQESFTIGTGDHFVIGGTSFTLSDERVNVTLDSPRAAKERAYSPDYLQSLAYRDADQRIEVLSRLPEVISGAATDGELCVRLIGLILTGIPRATAAAVVAVDGSEPSELRVLHWDRRRSVDRDFAPSGRLIRSAVSSGKSVVSIWDRQHSRQSATFVDQDDVDWAFCTPVLGRACPGWAIYVTGRFPPPAHGGLPQRTPEELHDELKFAELATTTLHNLRDVRMLEQQQSSLRPFFSPVVLEALAGQDPETVLLPRQADVSVLFCDLRGFSRRSEQQADDLLGLLNRVSRRVGRDDALHSGPGRCRGRLPRRCRHGVLGLADRGRQRDRKSLSRRALDSGRVRRGRATGRSPADRLSRRDWTGHRPGRGRQDRDRRPGESDGVRAGGESSLPAGNHDQSAAGPGVDRRRDGTACAAQVPASVARVRRVARVRPYGMDAAVEVSELLPPEADFPQLSDQHIAAYETALDALLSRDWDTAFQWLHNVPAEDRVKDYLTVFIAQHNRMPPANWDGVIPIHTK